MKRIFGLMFVAAMFINANAQQAEQLSTDASTAISIGRHENTNEHVRLVSNEVSTIGRHCQKYVHKSGHLWWKHSKVNVDACNADESTIFFVETSSNLRTNAGGDAQSKQMGDTATQPASCNFVAVTNDSGAPAAGDTTLASEITTNGLGRAQGTFAHTTGTTVFTITKTFNATGTQASQKAGLFNASSSGTMCFENTYSAVTVNNGDTLTVTWTVNI